jgi:hypothetical protein
MVENSLYLQFLLSGVFGFVENTYIQLQDCCKYKQQGIIFVIDRENQDYEDAKKTNFDEPFMSTVILTGAIMNNNGFPIIASKSVVKALLKYHDFHDPDRATGYIKSRFKIKQLEDFYILFPINTSIEGLNGENLSEIDWGQVDVYVPGGDNSSPIENILEKLFKRNSRILWMVYCIGHGVINNSITGLRISDFTKFMGFLEKKINTKILLYHSCYAGGVNKIKAFEEQASDKSAVQRYYSFPIIALSPADAPASLIGEHLILFNNLFSSLASIKFDMPDYYQILSNANFLKLSVDEKNTLFLVSNFPQIRLPGTEWFSTTGINRIATNKNDDYAVISKVMGKTREKELKIKKTVKAIFLYAPIIPFKLTIPKPDAQMRMVCMDASDAYHFSQINAPELTFIDLCKFFAPLKGIEGKDTTFYIDKLVYKNKVMKNCVFSMYYENQDKFTFHLIAQDSKNAFFASAHPKRLSETTLDVSNYVEVALGKKIEVEMPEAHTPDSLDALKKVFAKRAASFK